jgi:hypothetical protein
MINRREGDDVFAHTKYNLEGSKNTGSVYCTSKMVNLIPILKTYLIYFSFLFYFKNKETNEFEYKEIILRFEKPHNKLNYLVIKQDVDESSVVNTENTDQK